MRQASIIRLEASLAGKNCTLAWMGDQTRGLNLKAAFGGCSLALVLCVSSTWSASAQSETESKPAQEAGGEGKSSPSPFGNPRPEEPKAPSTMKLRTGITHSEALAPIPQIQRPGRLFRGDAVSAGAQRMKRMKVPDWLAGIWQRYEAREISRIELPSGRKAKPVGNQVARVRDVFGTYRDSNGQVWQLFNPAKATGQVDRGLSIDYHRVHSYDLVITGPKTAVVEVQATHTLVSKANRRIASVYQDEELNKYSLLPDGKLQTDSSVKVFNMDGKPFLLTRTMSAEIRQPPKNWPPRLNSPLQGN